jgi:hypothetical protein
VTLLGYTVTVSAPDWLIAVVFVTVIATILFVYRR